MLERIVYESEVGCIHHDPTKIKFKEKVIIDGSKASSKQRDKSKRGWQRVKESMHVARG